jgi:hypothetical protein
MKKIVLTFGLISGAISATLMMGTVPFIDKIGFDKGAVIGYTSMVLSFLLVFFGIRSYRENVGNGEISFLRAFSVGILITVISCACYVVTWEIVYFKIMPGFVEKYTSYVIEQFKASGATVQEIEAKRQELARFRELYANPFFNVAVTFLEPFPVGFVITLLSAFILRRKQKVLNGGEQLARS